MPRQSRAPISTGTRALANIKIKKRMAINFQLPAIDKFHSKKLLSLPLSLSLSIPVINIPFRENARARVADRRASLTVTNKGARAHLPRGSISPAIILRSTARARGI